MTMEQTNKPRAFSGRSFILSVSEKREASTNKLYPKKAVIASLDELLDHAKFDHVGGVFKDNTRGNENFISADVLIMDCDNDSDNAQEWLTPQDIAGKLPDVMCYAVYSRNHNKQKDNKTARPRFHMYYPLAKTVSTPDGIRAMKEALLRLVPEFDAGAKDGARLVYGVKQPQGEAFEGALCVDEFLAQQSDMFQSTRSDETQETHALDNDADYSGHDDTSAEDISADEDINFDDDIIPEGLRNSELYCRACRIVRICDNDDDALARYNIEVAKCRPPLPFKEVQTIWGNANAFVKKAKRTEEAQRKKERKLRQKAEEAQRKKEQREARRVKPVTLRVVEDALTELDISVSFNVVNKEISVSHFPASELVNKSYYSLTPAKQKKMAGKYLGAFLWSYLKEHRYASTKTFVEECVEAVAEAHPYNPVMNLILSTTWDNVDRIQALFDIIGLDSLWGKAEDYKFQTALIRKWLHQAIALLNNDDGRRCADFVLVLQGAQGVGKTAFFRALSITSDYFAEGCTIDTNKKDTIIQSTSTFLSEIGELDATLKREQATLKSFLTAKFDTYRVPYGIKADKYERRTSFCATINPRQALRDETGSRRFAIIHVDSNMDKSAIYNEMTREWALQLWRQVYDEVYCPNPDGFYLSDEELAYIMRANREYAVDVELQPELEEALSWVRDDMPLEQYVGLWEWLSLSEIKDRASLDKDKPVSIMGGNKKLGTALRAIYNRLGLDVEELTRKVMGYTQYKVPPKRYMR